MSTPHRSMSEKILSQITDGRTDLEFEYLSLGHAATKMASPSSSGALITAM